MSDTSNSKHLADIGSKTGQMARRRAKGPSVIAGRTEAFSGRNDIQTATEINVDPASCKMWSHHDRDYESLTPKNTLDLISSIGSDGQHIAAVARRCSDSDVENKGYEYEIVCGARRHFAISHMRRTNPEHKNIGLKIRVYSIDDEEAFRMSDAENRAREDISDYERAMKYQKALGTFYSNQKEMAKALGETEAWLSLFLKLAKIPLEVVKAFKKVGDLKTYHARQLSPFIADSKLKSKLCETAKRLEQDQKKSEEGIDANSVIKQLIDGCRDKRKSNPPEPIKPTTVSNSAGVEMVSYKVKKDGNLTIDVLRNNGGTADELIAAIKEIINNC